MNALIPSKIDVPVLLIFFSRPGCFAQVFEQVKKARPSKLFLYQDGPREGNQKDIDGIAKCRAIAENIDWACEVHRFYQEKNIGCDPSEFIAQKWAFSLVDKCIILEDDDVPTLSFFRFCKELLERYEDDDRVNMICGMNNVESWDTPHSYLFSETGSIWGWATWKRVVDEWEGDYAFLDDKEALRCLADKFREQGQSIKTRLSVWKRNRLSGVEHYETILGCNQLLKHRLNIVPAKNMIINVGNTPEGSTHSRSSLAIIPRGLRRIYTMKSFEIDFPLKHPKYIVEDVAFRKSLFRIMGTGHPVIAFFRRVETALLMWRHEGFKSLWRKIRKTR